MKNKYMQTSVGTLVAFLVLFGATQIFVSGEDLGSDGRTSAAEHSAKSIEGVWQTTVTQRNCQTGDAIRTFRGLSTFHEGGTMSENAASSSPSLRSASHGIWARESRETYTGSFVFLRFNPDGTFAGTQRTTVINVLTGNGNTYDSTASIQVFDANNNLLGTGCATAVGTRFE